MVPGRSRQTRARTTNPSSATAISEARFWTGEAGEFRPPKYASPVPLLNDKPYPTAGRLVGRWIEKYLRHGEGDALGQKVRLALFWWYILQRLYEYHPVTGQLAHDRILIGVAKGNSKTEGTGQIGDAELLGPIAPVLSPRVVLSAASYPQTTELFTAARLGIVGDPDHDNPGPLLPFFVQGENLLEDRILLPSGHGLLQRIAAVGGTNDGGKPTAHLGDEVHELVTDRAKRMYVVQGKSLKKRRVIRKTPESLGLPKGVNLWGAIQVGITTAGASHDSLLGTLYDYGVSVATGEIEDPGFLFLWWEADEKWDLEQPEERRQAILEANPGIGAFLPYENVEASFHDRTIPRIEFIRYNLNRWPDAETAYMPPAVWDATANPVRIDPLLPAYASVGVTHDHKSGVVAIAQKQDDLVVVRCEHFPKTYLPSGKYLDVSDIEKTVELLHRSYPASVLAPKRLSPRSPEKILPVPGPEVAYNGTFFEGSAQRLRAAGVAMVDIPNSAERLAPAAETILGLALDSKLVHEDDPVLAQHMRDVVQRPTPTGWHVTPREGKVIVSAVAAMVAVHRAVTAPRASISKRRLGVGF